MKTSEEIPELPELLEEIKNAAEKQELAIFIGAGVSRFYDCTSWNELANNLLKECFSKNIIDAFEEKSLSQNNDCKKVITICHELLKNFDNNFMNQMKKSLNNEDENIDKILTIKGEPIEFPIYKDLIKLGGLFITTNADRHIDKIFHHDNIVINNFNVATKIDKKYLYKIHGSIIDEDSLIFTLDKYLERYTSTDYGDFLVNIFSKYTVLFVGYGLGEFELLDYLYKTISKKSKQHYFLKDYFNHEQKIRDFDQLYFNQLKNKVNCLLKK